LEVPGVESGQRGFVTSYQLDNYITDRISSLFEFGRNWQECAQSCTNVDRNLTGIPLVSPKRQTWQRAPAEAEAELAEEVAVT
jgi:hypothetical protein